MKAADVGLLAVFRALATPRRGVDIRLAKELDGPRPQRLLVGHMGC